MKSYWNIANLISLGNASCGILSIFNSIELHFQNACLLMLVAVLFDFLDGKIARHYGQATVFGKGLDCLSDIVSFGVAPAVFGLFMQPSVLGHSTEPFPTVTLQISLVLFVLTGIWRLAYFFQWSGSHRPPGMPITMNGFIFPVLFLLHVPDNVFLVAFVVSTILMVGPIFLKPPLVS